jgi:hypothetical protein
LPGLLLQYLQRKIFSKGMQEIPQTGIIITLYMIQKFGENTTMVRHSFVYGRPVKGDEFIGRRNELSTIFSRLCNGDSTAIVGEPHIGKTSLLLQIMDPSTQADFLEEDRDQYTFSFIDLLPMNSGFSPEVFWEQALEPLAQHPIKASVSKILKNATDAGYSNRTLERLFGHLAKENLRLVLLLDEFDRLLNHPNFRDPSFFAHLRSLSTHVGGLSYITASRATVAQMNESGRGLLDTGSPFFNQLIPVVLKPFSDREIIELLDHAAPHFVESDMLYITRMAGRHPFLLQAMAATFLECDPADRKVKASENFYERIAAHFDDLWYAMDDHSRTAALILSIMELEGTALGKDFSFGEIERVKAFGPELHKLTERGLAQCVSEGWQFDWDHLLLWQGERWAIGPLVFTWWVRDTVIAGERQVPAYNEWLARKGYKGLITEEQWEKLQRAARALPNWVIRGAAEFIRTFIMNYWK